VRSLVVDVVGVVVDVAVGLAFEGPRVAIASVTTRLAMRRTLSALVARS
jgi:hypothetical protein